MKLSHWFELVVKEKNANVIKRSIVGSEVCVIERPCKPEKPVLRPFKA